MADLFFRWAPPAQFSANRQKEGGPQGGVPSRSPGDSGKKPAASHNLTPILLLMGNNETRNYLSNLLTDNFYHPIWVKSQKELLRSVQQQEAAVILMDCAAVTRYGAGILSKIKVACQSCRIIMFCEKAHLGDKPHRELIKDILNIGIYACILTPYQDWEILSMISGYPPKG